MTEFNSTDITLGSENIFDDLGFSSEEAVNLKIRTDLMLALRTFIKEKGWTQQESSVFFNESRSQIKNLIEGEISCFTVDELLSLLDKTGMKVKVEVLAN